MEAKLKFGNFEVYINRDKTFLGRSNFPGQFDRGSIGLSSVAPKRHFVIFKEEGRYVLKCRVKKGVIVDGKFLNSGDDAYPLKHK